jgi:Lon protease-like protein
MSDETRELPLFPLQTLLFPGGTLPLHIFEPRYRAMLHACLAGDERFGVVLIAEGKEVGGPAVPYLTGTIARIALAEPLAGGRYNLMTTGERRFTIVRTWLDPAGYLVGQVRLRPELLDEEPARLAAMTDALRATLHEYVGRLTDEAGPIQEELARVTDPLRLSGVAASLLRGDATVRQRILEDDSVPRRLQRLHALLRRELRVLDLLARPTRAALQRDVISPN